MTRQEELEHWQRISPRSWKKLEDAEQRLGESLASLFERWLATERLPMRMLTLKLDVGFNTVKALVKLYGYDEEVSVNRKEYLKNIPIRHKSIHAPGGH